MPFESVQDTDHLYLGLEVGAGELRLSEGTSCTGKPYVRSHLAGAVGDFRIGASCHEDGGCIDPLGAHCKMEGGVAVSVLDVWIHPDP